MSGKFTVFTGKNGETYFNLKAGNGDIILQSQGYKSVESAHRGIESVRANAKEAARFEKQTSESGKFHFHLKATNHQIIGQSQMYATERGCDEGIASVMANAPGATLVEE